MITVTSTSFSLSSELSAASSTILTDEIHMEEEGVQVKVQEEEEIRETHGREQGEE